MTIKAIYKNGVFKPITPVDLAEGEWVDLNIVRPPSRHSPKVVSLQGVWKEKLRPEDEGDWVSETIAEIRRQSAEKVERLAGELDEGRPRG